MTAPYAHPGWTRIAALPSVVDMASPSLTEMVFTAIDITNDVLVGGLSLVRETETVAAGRWADRFQGTRPGRYSMKDGSLAGRRYAQGGAEPLWDMATIGTHKILVVRRGIRSTVRWHAGQHVETFDVTFGQRAVRASGNEGVFFDVPLHVRAEFDSATIGTGGLLTIDDESGEPLEEEDGDDLYVESP